MFLQGPCPVRSIAERRCGVESEPRRYVRAVTNVV